MYYYSVFNLITINDNFEKIYIEPKIHTQPNRKCESIALKNYVTPWNIEQLFKRPIVSFSFRFTTPTPELSRTSFQKQLVTTVGLKKFYKKNKPTVYCPRPSQTPSEKIPLCRKKDVQNWIDVFHFQKYHAPFGRSTIFEHHISIEPKPGIKITTKYDWLCSVNQFLSFMGVKSGEDLSSIAFQFSVSVQNDIGNNHQFRVFCSTHLFELYVNEEQKILFIDCVDKNNYFIEKKVVWLI
ncbi:hypothetical protein CDIK_0454 [Cucumispora dikerogammari]|nr:hypothetical protein CDIK_0454 [Cucumispora dikerogammari]